MNEKNILQNQLLNCNKESREYHESKLQNEKINFEKLINEKENQIQDQKNVILNFNLKNKQNDENLKLQIENLNESRMEIKSLKNQIMKQENVIKEKVKENKENFQKMESLNCELKLNSKKHNEELRKLKDRNHGQIENLEKKYNQMKNQDKQSTNFLKDLEKLYINIINTNARKADSLAEQLTEEQKMKIPILFSLLDMIRAGMIDKNTKEYVYEFCIIFYSMEALGRALYPDGDCPSKVISKDKAKTLREYFAQNTDDYLLQFEESSDLISTRSSDS